MLDIYMDMRNRLWIEFVGTHTYRTRLHQYAGDTFYFDFFGSGIYLILTFFLDEEGIGEYAATRAGVARRVEEDEEVTAAMKARLIPRDEWIKKVVEQVKRNPRFFNFRPGFSK